jgi:hypothetical protein
MIYALAPAWNVQVWGAVAGSSGALDLDNFERHHVKLRVGVRFLNVEAGESSRFPENAIIWELARVGR